MTKPFLVGITGGSGSGKTFLLNQLKNHFATDEICLISQDNYYHPRETQVKDQNGVTNFDLPEAIDHAAFAKDVLLLKSGQKVEKAEYTFNNPLAAPNIITLSPAPVVLVEGLFVFHEPQVSTALDLKVFVSASEATMLQRRIDRDAKERGYGIEDVTYRFENHVLPSYKTHILPHRDLCDFVVDNDQVLSDLELLVERIKLSGFVRTRT